MNDTILKTYCGKVSPFAFPQLITFVVKAWDQTNYSPRRYGAWKLSPIFRNSLKMYTLSKLGGHKPIFHRYHKQLSFIQV